tara:strand:- start:8867 stop:9862 length:996 start_codon:yes stop_codon:yes gene_type:complete
LKEKVEQITMQKELILVTGGAGFIGSHVVERLLRRNVKVAVLDNFRSGKRENIEPFLSHPDFVLVKADITQGLWATLHTLTKEHGPIARIFHFAAQISVVYSIEHPLEDTQINAVGTLQLLEYARHHNIKKFIFASSAATYGDTEIVPTPEDAPKLPLSPYAFNKLSSEHQLQYAWAIHKLPTIGFRFFNVYGPRQDPKSPYSGVISIFLDRATKGSSITIFGSGDQTRDFVYVGDLASLLVEAAFGEEGNGEIFNVGTGKAHDIKTLAETIVSLTESESSILYVEKRAGDILHSCAVIEKAKERFGFSPEHNLKEGLSKTLAWFKETTTS